MNIKKLVLAAGIVLLLTTGIAAQATLTLQGTVNAVAEITFSPASVTDLDLGANYGGGHKINDITIKCNDHDGYTVTLTSAHPNGATAQLVGGTTAETFDYDLRIGATNINFPHTGPVITENSKTGRDGNVFELYIIYNGTTMNPAADTYSDTLTFTITAQ